MKAILNQVYFDVFFTCVVYAYTKVIIGIVCGAHDHLKVINLFLFYRSANDFVNRRFVITLSSLRCTALLCLPTTLPYYLPIYSLCPRPSSALTHFHLV